MFFKENKRHAASSLHKIHCIDGLDRLSDAYNNLESNNYVCPREYAHIEDHILKNKAYTFSWYLILGPPFCCEQEKEGNKDEQVHLSDYFDLFAGSSTGAILSTMLVTPDEQGRPLFTAKGCCEFYSKHGEYIFRPRWYDPFHGSVRQFYRPKYSPRRFENLLKEYTVRKNGKVLTLLDTLKPLLVTSFDISRATPFFFVRQAAEHSDSRNFR